MPEPARAGAEDQQRETPITVDLANADPKAAVTRTKPRGEAVRTTTDDEGSETDLTLGMRRRIAKMKRSFDQQLADQQALHQRELASLRGEVDRMSVQRVGADDAAADEAAHERDMAALQTKLEEAQEKGESKEVARLTREMSTADAKYWAKKTQQTLNPEGDTNKDTRRRTRTDDAGADPAAGATTVQNTAARRWTEANELWWEDEEFAAERGAANGIHNSLIKEGSDPKTDAHYVEVTRRLQKKFPKLAIEMPASVARRRLADELGDRDDVDDEETGKGTRRRSPVRSTGGTGDDAQASRNRLDVQLDAQDQATMRAIGLDPRNDKHVLQFAQSKRETIEAYERASA